VCRWALAVVVVCGLVPAGPVRAASLANPGTPTAAPNAPSAAPLPPVAVTGGERVVGRVGDSPITFGQLVAPLVEAYGVPMLLHVARNAYYRQMARDQGVTVGPDDLAAERRRMLEQLFGPSFPLESYTGTDAQRDAARLADMERLLPQLLASQKITEPEFTLALENGAILWKIATKLVEPQITEDALRRVFGIKYGEKAQVRHIQVSNLLEMAEARRRLNEGKSFADVAAEMSQDERSRPFGGAIRPFTRAEPTLAQAFKDAAFALHEGEVSEAVHDGTSYHLILLEKLIAPQVIKYEDVRDFVREELTAVLVNLQAQRLRETYDAQAIEKLQIDDPGLRARFVERARQADPAAVRQRIGADNTPVTPPGSEVARPPATWPGQ
jgi:parvulin-like peptidyl-prolyl isomerase